MKFSAAALVLLVAAPTSLAFVPQTRGFGISTSKAAAQAFKPTSLWSTTIDEDDIAATIKNSVAQAELEEILKTPQKSREPKADEPLAQLSADETRAVTAEYISKYEGQSGASVIYSKLVENGIDVVNGFSGGAVLPLLDQFHEHHPRHAALENAPIRWLTN